MTQLYLVRRNGRIDYTCSAAPKPAPVIKPGRKSGPDGDWVMSQNEAEYLTAQLASVGPTVELRESRIKVRASEVEIVAGPFALRNEPSDDPDYPKMTRTVVETPAGTVCWSNKHATHLLPDGRTCGSLACAISLALGLS